MAIYRTGKASLAANGIVTGYGTKWRETLKLIRVGATIVFASNPAEFATIIEIVSDTELRVADSAGKVIPESEYVILLHDSLTVDGLAQDVAETLRYYQGRETEFAHFIDLIRNMDLEKIEETIGKMKEQVDRFEKNYELIQATAKKVEENAAKAETNANVASESAGNAQRFREEAEDFRDETQTLRNSAADSVDEAKGQVVLAGNQVALAKQQADRAQGIVDSAKNEVVQSAASEVQKATEQADRAKTEADRAHDLANQFDANKLLRTDKNLSDLENKQKARINLGVDNIEYNDLETKVMTKNKNTWLTLRNKNGKPWGVYDNEIKAWVALEVAQGGTGATSLEGARKNLKLDRVHQDENMTRISASDPKTELRIGTDDWYVYRTAQDSTAGYVALGVQGGGTGANDAAGARANLHVFQQRKNSLSGSENLNDLIGYEKSGYYHNAANANATTDNNYPISQAGVLLVTSSQANGVNQTQQYYFPFARNDIYYTRHYNLTSGVWSWTKWTEFKGSQETLDSVGMNRTGVIGPKNANDIQRNCFFAGGGTDSQNYILPYQSGISMRRVNTTSQMQIDAGNGQIWTRGSVDGGSWTDWRRAAMENAVVTFQNVFSDAKSDAERAASGIVNGRLLSGSGAVRHAWRVYSEIRTDNKTYMTMHLQAANGANKYLGFDQDGNLVGINSVNCTGANVGSSGINVNAGGECVRIKGTDANAAMYMIARNSDNSLNWYVGKGSRDNDQVVLHSYKYNTTLTLRQGDIITNKDMTIGGNNIVNGSTCYVDGGEGTSNSHFWLRNRSKRSRAVMYTADNQVLTLRSDNGATGGAGQSLQLFGATGECKAAKFTATSDERAKFWMKPVTGALDKVCQLRGMTYSMHTTLQNTVRNAGIIAQDVQKVLPEAVTVTKGDDHSVLNKNCDKVDNPLSLDYNALSALYVEAFKELKAEIEALKAEIEILKSK